MAIVCALRRPELDQVLRINQGAWEELPHQPDDPSTYFTTLFARKDCTPLSVVAAAPTQMGLPAAAVLATKMILLFRPGMVAMPGIAAGLKQGDQGFGDLIAASMTFDYGAGKYSSDSEGGVVFAPDPNPIHIDPRLLARLQHWSAERTSLESIARSWPAPKPKTSLELHVGQLASGAAVVNAPEPIASARQGWRKLQGVEMEAYGVHLACRDAVSPQPLFLCVKAICDFASNKSDDWQAYAAFTAAQFVSHFVTAEWAALFASPRS